MPRAVRLTRRHFLGSVAAAATVAALPARSWARVLGAGSRLRIGVIGTGGMGTSHLHDFVDRKDKDNVEVTRVCDVYRKRLNAAVGVIGATDAAATMEYREVLDDKDVDAVLIATPDHWHVKIATEAMAAGKHVYCEKPLSLTVEQALQCRDAVHRTGKVLQVGPQGTSEDRWWKAGDAIRAGRIGKVSWSQGAYCRNSREGQFNWAIDPKASPDVARESEDFVWWDRWLGHEWGLAEQIPWNPDRFFRFRKYFAYNGGLATDLLYHRLAPLLLAISGPQGEYPRRVVAAGGQYVERDGRDIPDTFQMLVDYPSGHTILLSSVMTNDVGLEDMIRGQRGTLTFDDGVIIREQAEWWPEFRKVNGGLFEQKMVTGDDGSEKPEPAPGQAQFKLFTAPRRDHKGNFLDAIRDGAPLDCGVDLGCSTMVAIKMAVESYRRDKVLLWDAAAERVVEG
jgi:predicted dehydrogenase